MGCRIIKDGTFEGNTYTILFHKALTVYQGCQEIWQWMYVNFEKLQGFISSQYICPPLSYCLFLIILYPFIYFLSFVIILLLFPFIYLCSYINQYLSSFYLVVKYIQLVHHSHFYYYLANWWKLFTKWHLLSYSVVY